VFVEGEIRSSSYDDREGVKRYRTEIHARQVLLNGKGGGTRQPAPAEPDKGGDDYSGDFGATDDNIPF
jgi:single-strand DNA-binding protein